ncbi:MAG: ABC transporter permease [Dehalococcoidales bacterium]|nr:ABC transporter permease [Dehalococcoidales bacterium]
MTEIWNGLVQAVKLIIGLDPEVLQIAVRSLQFALTSTVIGSLIFIPLGSLIHFNEFTGKKFLISLIQTLYAVPTVAIGLFVFVFLSRSGPLGSWGLLYSPTAIIIGQSILIGPILVGLTISAFKGVDRPILDTARSLGANGIQLAMMVVKEARYAVISAIIMAFGRAISEVGVSLMVGGNIKGFTRVLTTAISLETSKGDIEFSMALGIILVGMALVVNIIMSRVQQR